MSSSSVSHPSLPFFQVIAAIGEQKASKALQEAATVIAESPSALQVGPSVTGRARRGKQAAGGGGMCSLAMFCRRITQPESLSTGDARTEEEETMSNLLLAEVFCRIRSREAFLPSFLPSLWRWSSHLPSVLKRRVIYWLLLRLLRSGLLCPLPGNKRRGKKQRDRDRGLK